MIDVRDKMMEAYLEARLEGCTRSASLVYARVVGQILSTPLTPIKAATS